MRIDGINKEFRISANLLNNNASADNSIQKQIEAKKQELQKLAENEEMSPEEKMKKRQEINKEIYELNSKLMKHQIEQRNKQMDNSSVNNLLGVNKRLYQKKSKKRQYTGLSQENMQSVISANSSLEQAKVQKSVSVKMQGQASVLEAEIKQSKGNGGAVERKEAELDSIKIKAEKAETSQMNTLNDINAALRNSINEPAFDTDKDNEVKDYNNKINKKEEQKEKADKKTKDNQTKKITDNENSDTQISENVGNNDNLIKASSNKEKDKNVLNGTSNISNIQVNYVPIDIYL